MTSNNSYSIEDWADRMAAKADRMAAHLQDLNIKAAEIEKQTAAAKQPLIMSEQVINFLKQYEKQQSKEKHMAEIKSAGNNYNL